MTQHIFDISEDLLDDRCLIGGKAVGLGKLCRMGFSVPGGIVISCSVSSLLDRTFIDLIQDRLSCYSDDKSLFAVRSSTTVEDGESKSYAGIFESYLNVKLSNIVDALEKCLNSSLSPRVAAYQRLQHEDVVKNKQSTVSIIVQQMVNASCSGVAFSADPITKEKTRLFIEAATGLGEAIVSGSITPDLYILNANNGDIIERKHGDNFNCTEWTLDSKKLAEIRETVIQLRYELGHEIDLEFAFDNNTLYTLQVRPITTM